MTPTALAVMQVTVPAVLTIIGAQIALHLRLEDRLTRLETRQDDHFRETDRRISTFEAR